MTPEDIKKLPTPETDSAKKDFWVGGLGGNYEGTEGVYVGVSRSLEQRLAAAVMVMQNFSHRMTEIHDDPAYQSVWAINQLHAGQYQGPTYVIELAELRKTLASIRSMK